MAEFEWICILDDELRWFFLDAISNQYVQLYKTTRIVDNTGFCSVTVCIGRVPPKEQRKIKALAQWEWQAILNRFKQFGLTNENNVDEVRVYCWMYRKKYEQFGNMFVDETIRQVENDQCVREGRKAGAMFEAIRAGLDRQLLLCNGSGNSSEETKSIRKKEQ